MFRPTAVEHQLLQIIPKKVEIEPLTPLEMHPWFTVQITWDLVWGIFAVLRGFTNRLYVRFRLSPKLRCKLRERKRARKSHKDYLALLIGNSGVYRLHRMRAARRAPPLFHHFSHAPPHLVELLPIQTDRGEHILQHRPQRGRVRHLHSQFHKLPDGLC